MQKLIRVKQNRNFKFDHMKINIQAPHLNVNQSLVNFINKKLDKLNLVYDKIISSEVLLKVNNTSEKENKIVEVLLHIPGGQLVIKKEAATFEAAIDDGAHSLRRRLKRRKEKQRTRA